MNPLLATIADLLVACLLVATIVTSIRLSRRIAAMKADEATMRTTILELMQATERADAAIASLRQTVVETDRSLSDRLGAAARHTERLAEEVLAGEAVIERVSKIAAISRRLRHEEDAGEIAPPVPRSSLLKPLASEPAASAPSRDDGLREAIRLARDASSRLVGGQAA